MKTLKLKTLPTAVRYFLICLFIYAAISKGAQFPVFLIQLSSSPLIPLSLVKTTGLTIILFELSLVILLFSEKFAIIGLWLSYSLMLFFTLYILYLLNFPEFIPCACGGILGAMSHQTHLFFNATVTIVILFAIWIEYKNENKSQLPMSNNL